MKPALMLILALSVSTIFSFTVAAHAETTATTSTAKAKVRAKARAKKAQGVKKTAAAGDEKPSVGTDFRFDDLTVHGQYQSANEGLVTVENDKELTNLLDYRTEYKDRLRDSRLNP